MVSQTRKLREADIPVYIVAGNHDAASKITKTLRFPENVKLFPAEKPSTFRVDKIDVAIHGQSFVSPAVKKDLSIKYPFAIEGCFNIGMLHTCVTGSEEHEHYAPCTIDGLRSKGYNYWALGHVHKLERLLEDPLVVFPGNIQGRYFRETGPKGCVLVSVDDNYHIEWEFKALDVIRWIILNVDASDSDNGYDVVDQFKKQLTVNIDENEGIPLVTRVVVKGETKAHDEFVYNAEQWINEIRSAALDVGGGLVWVEKVKFCTNLPVSEKDFKSSDGAIGELLNVLDELYADADGLQGLAEVLADLEIKLPRELKEGADGLMFKDPEWLKSMLDQVRPILLRRLIHKEKF